MTPSGRNAPSDPAVARVAGAALALFIVHAALLFFPPLPPDVKGSLWSYLAGYVSVVVGLVAVHRAAGAIAAGWARRAGPVLRLGIVGLAAGVLAVGVVLVEWAPELSRRFNREEGLWEPVTLFVYWGAALLLFRRGRTVGSAAGRHLRLVASAYLLLGLEEIDYFGIVGGFLPRIDGIYVGSLHDLANLAAEGALPAGVVLMGAGAAAALGVLLAVTGHLQPRRIAGMLTRPSAAWAACGTALVVLGAVAPEVGGEAAARWIPEEATELAGAILLLAWALEIAGERVVGSAGAAACG